MCANACTRLIFYSVSGGQRKGEHIREARSRSLATLCQATFLMVLLRRAGKARRKQRQGETSLVRVQEAITPGRYLDPKSLHHLNNAMLQRAGPNYTW